MSGQFGAEPGDPEPAAVRGAVKRLRRRIEKDA